MASALMKYPRYFTSAVLQDAIFDLPSYLFSNYSERNIDLFGDVKDKQVYEFCKTYSPYQMEIPKTLKNVLVTSTTNDPTVTQTRKFIARLRTHFKGTTNNELIFYKEFEPDVTDIYRFAVEFSFLMKNY